MRGLFVLSTLLLGFVAFTTGEAFAMGHDHMAHGADISSVEMKMEMVNDPAKALEIVMKKMQSVNGSKLCMHKGGKSTCPMPAKLSTGCCLKNCDSSGAANSVSVPLLSQFIPSYSQSLDINVKISITNIDSIALVSRSDLPGLMPPTLI